MSRAALLSSVSPTGLEGHHACRAWFRDQLLYANTLLLARLAHGAAPDPQEAADLRQAASGASIQQCVAALLAIIAFPGAGYFR